MPSVVLTTGTSAFHTIVSQSPSFSSLLQEARESMAAVITNAILQSFIVFISIFVVNVPVYINANCRKILHRRALNVLNRLFFEVGSVGSEADNCPNEREFIVG
jgi:hypothetical protein